MRLILVLLFLSCCLEVSAQHLPFYGSLREPSNLSNLYFGASISGSISFDNTSIPILEKQIECCRFEKGSTKQFSVGASTEYWLEPQWTIGGTVGFISQSTVVSKESLPIPRREKPPLVTEYTGTIQSTVLFVQPQTKYRISGTNLSVGTAFSVGVPFSPTSTLTENDVSEQISGNPLFTEKTLLGFDQSLQSILLEPSILIGYDFPIRNGQYLSSTTHIGYRPYLLKNQDFTSISLRLQISYLFGI